MKNQKTSLLIALVGLAFIALYLIASFLPDAWWGLHAVAFLPPVLKWLFFGLALVAVILPLVYKDQLLPSALKVKYFKPLIFIGVALVASLVYFKFPMHKSLYGDAVSFQQEMGERTAEYNSKYSKALISPNVLHPKIGNITVLSAVRLISWKFGITHRQAYRWLDAVSGFVFVLIWLVFINWYVESHVLKWVFYIIGLTAPFGIFYFGYEEIYAPGIVFSAAYLMVLVAYFKTRRKLFLWLSPLLLFLCLKVYAIYVLLVPSLLFLILFHVFQDKPKWLRFLEWKKLALLFFIPVILFGLFVYFFIMKDYNDERFLGPEVDIYTRMFLPIISPPEPYDRYTMFHFNHLFDYFNMAFLWSAGAIFVLVTCVLFFRKHINWNRPELVVIGTSLLLLLMVYFAYNPLMSMPVDFDLYSMAGPALLMLSVVVAAQLNTKGLGKMLLGPITALGILSIPVFIIHTNAGMLSQRLQSVGVHVFKTYWIRSAGDIIAGVELLNDPDEKLKCYLEAEEKLKPYALEGKDVEFASLLLEIAKLYRNDKQDLHRALYYHQQVLRYDQSSGAYYIGLMEVAFRLGEYDLALTYSQVLLRFGYPSEQKALKIARDCAIVANQYDLALQYCNSYLSKWQDEDMVFVRESLLKGEYLEEIKFAIKQNARN